MRVLLLNGLNPDNSVDLYEDLAERLRARSIDVELIHGREAPAASLQGCDLLISNMDVPAVVRARMPVYAGRRMPRPESLRLLESSGVPTMEWALARTRLAVWKLFGAWRTERVLLKPSYTYGGKDIRVFSRGAVWRLRWSRDVDVFCPEVNPDDGDVYKAELLNGRVLIAWKSASPPLRELFRRGILRGVRGAYGDRSPCEFPPGVMVKLEGLSRVLTDNGLGHVSVDFMRRSDGELVAIELNPRGVATWWTRQFAHYRERYVEALYELTLRHRFEHSTSQTEP